MSETAVFEKIGVNMKPHSANEFFREQRIYTERQEAFGDSAALYHDRFQNDNGSVEQRIFDRVLEMCVPVCFDGESLR